MSSINPPDKDSTSIVVRSQTPRFTLDADVVLPATTRLQLEECLTRLRYHRVIYHDWGFQAVDPMGRSLIISLRGAPGTGKTLVAEALAGTLGRPFIHLGIAEVESSLLGATGRNIVAAFEAASKDGAVLFFDESDSLLGRRLSSVTQGVDQEVNAMRSTMFIELERFDGVVIFASNLAESYDKAFLSRISYHVEFVLPGFDELRALWSRMITPGIPLAQDRESLVTLCAERSAGLSGREIRTCLRVALPKALLAVDGEPSRAALRWDDLSSAIDQVRSAHSTLDPPQTQPDPRIQRIRKTLDQSIQQREQGDGIAE